MRSTKTTIRFKLSRAEDARALEYPASYFLSVYNVCQNPKRIGKQSQFRCVPVWIL